jgi:hypothetical protein
MKVGGAAITLATATSGKASAAALGGLAINGKMSSSEAYERMMSGHVRTGVVLTSGNVRVEIPSNLSPVHRAVRWMLYSACSIVFTSVIAST